MHRKHAPFALAGLFFLLAVIPTPAFGEPQESTALPRHQRQWVAEVSFIITQEELEAFRALEKDYQRDAFIEKFWLARDPTPNDHRNEYRKIYYDRLEEARQLFNSANADWRRDARTKILLLNGRPDIREEQDCGSPLWPFEIWQYEYSDVVRWPFTVIFFQRLGAPFRIWRPFFGYGQLLRIRSRGRNDFASLLEDQCALSGDFIEDILLTFEEVRHDGLAGANEAEVRPGPIDEEWLQTFHAYSTDLPPDAWILDAELALSFPRQHGSRTVVLGNLHVPVGGLGRAGLEDHQTYNLLLTGEVLRDEKLFETFRYRFDLPVDEVDGEAVPLVFERFLRPGPAAIVLKLADLNGHQVHRTEQTVEVPTLSMAEPATLSSDGTVGETAVAAAAGIEILPPPEGPISGPFEIETLTRVEGVRKVAFYLDGKPLMTRNRPPFRVRFNIGSVPRSHRLEAVALDANGAEIARDALELNGGMHRFAVRIVDPSAGTGHAGTVRVRAEVELPESQTLERLELYRDDTKVATLYDPPWSQPVDLPDHEQITLLRAVAYLPDGNATEHVVLLNAPGALEEVDVRLVELYATVTDPRGGPIQTLDENAFRVSENGAEQQILRFERLESLPIYATLVVDTSASMAENLETVNQAALRFLESTLTPRDRAAVVTFSERPTLAAGFTSALDELSGALAGLRAERSTALYDSIVFSLYYFKGIKGQRALVVLSDGNDRRSERSFEETLDFARHEGVPIYTIGINLGRRSREGRNKLSQLAAETGGRSFFLEDITELDAVYNTIQSELRAKYLIAYQSTHGRGDGSFRLVDVDVKSPGAEVRTLRGYYP